MPRISDILRYALILLVLIIAALFGMSLLRKNREHRALVGEMRSVVSDSSFYGQFYVADAHRTLFRAMYLIHMAESTGHEPAGFFDEVIGVEADSWLDRTDYTAPRVSPGMTLASETLRTNYEHCRKLGLLDDEDCLEDLAEGNAPVIPGGPDAGKPVEIHPVIDPALSPGLDKVLANLRIGPPAEATRKIGDIEIATARRLARDLENADIIEPTALDRILAHYAALAPK